MKSEVERHECSIETLKRSNAGLRGENKRLKNAINNRQERIIELSEELDDCLCKIDALNAELIKYRSMVERIKCLPWYKRLFFINRLF